MSGSQRKQLSPRSMRERRGRMLIAELRRLDASEEEISACQGEPETLIPLLMRTLELEAAQPDAKQLILLRRGEELEVSTVPKIRRLLAKTSRSDGDPSSVWSPGMKDWMSVGRFRQLLGLAADAARGASQRDEVAADPQRGQSNHSVAASNLWEDTVEEEEDEALSEYDEANFGSFPVVTDESLQEPLGQNSRAVKAAMAKAEVETMRAELARVEAEYAKMQTQLEESSGGMSATALGEQSAIGTEIPEEDALLEILNGVGELRGENMSATNTDAAADICPEGLHMDRYSPVGEVDVEEIHAAPSPTRVKTRNGSGKGKPLRMRLSQEVPLEELLQAQNEREDRRREQVEQQTADVEIEYESNEWQQQQQQQPPPLSSGQLLEEQEGEKDLSSRPLEDSNGIVKLEQLKARLTALDDAREAGALDQAAYIAARERVVAEAMAADNIAVQSIGHDTSEQHHVRLQGHGQDADKENYQHQQYPRQQRQNQPQKPKQRYKQQRYTDPEPEPESELSPEDEAQEHQRIVEQMMSGNFDGGRMQQHRKPIYSEDDYEDEDGEYSEVDMHREVGSLLPQDDDDVYGSPVRQQVATDQSDENFDPIVMSIMSEVPR